MHVVICCNRFPALSQPFITSQVMGLERRGYRVTVVAESIDGPLLATLLGGRLSGAFLNLDMDGEPPLSSLSSRLHLLGRALVTAPAFLRRSGDAICYLRPNLRWRGIMAARSYALAASIQKIDLVHAHMGETALWARSIALRHQVPFAITFHGSDVTREPMAFGWEVYRKLLDPGRTTFIAHSPFVADRLRLGLDVTPIRVPLGVDTTLFKPSNRSDGFRPQEGRPRLAFVGRLIPMKGLRIAIETLALLRSSASNLCLDATLDVVGEGPELANLELLAKVLGVDSSLRFRGPRSPAGVADALRNTDVLLVPSLNDVDGREEAYGLVCLEAHACGVPVVGTYCGGLPFAVDPPNGGRCVPQHSPLAMANAVRELVARSAAGNIQASLTARILSGYDENAYLDGYERAFEYARSRTGEAVVRSIPHGMLDWEPVQGHCQASPSAQGSLAAYVIGKDVLQLSRQQVDEILPGVNLVRSWTTVRVKENRTVAAAELDQVDVVLDLDGIEFGALHSELINLRRILRPGGIAMIATRLRETQSAAIDLKTPIGGFSKVIFLDRLFVPGPGGTVPPADPLETKVGGRRRQVLRYFLCAR